MIEVRHLTKTYGSLVAVDDLSFTVHPGRVTGFLGPNGAGKSTTMRMITGLDHPTHGEALVSGRRYADFREPLHAVGSLLEARGVHPGRSAYQHLLALAATSGIGKPRVEEVINLVGLGDVARKRVGGFSLGMGQRLGIAAALLGDPAVVMLDEPVNGLDPDGIFWIRGLLRGLAAEGRTVFVSSHLMSEMAMTADHLIILGRGRLHADVSIQEMTSSTLGSVRVRSPQSDQLERLLSSAGVTIERPQPDLLLVTGRTNRQIADLAFTHRLLLHELTPIQVSLEDAYRAMTRNDVEYVAEPNPNPRRVAA
jgi:ABC-2 type transport system ATP-binding protein